MGATLIGPNNGLSNSKLELATSSAGDVIYGKTFYAGDKTLRTGALNLSNGTATEADVLSGKTFYAGSTSIRTGTLNLGSKVSIVQINQPPVGNEYRNGSSSYNTGKQILWCPVMDFFVYGEDWNNHIQITSYSNGIIYYNWWVHDKGIRAYVPVIYA